MPAPTFHEQVLCERGMPLANGCIRWTGYVDYDGYGKVNRVVSGRRICTAHRLAFEVLVGRIPRGLEIDHLCRNRCCINVDHLELVDHATNNLRSVHPKNTHRNGRKTHCLRGHVLSGANLRIEIWKGRPARKCKACCLMRQRMYKGWLRR